LNYLCYGEQFNNIYVSTNKMSTFQDSNMKTAGLPELMARDALKDLMEYSVNEDNEDNEEPSPPARLTRLLSTTNYTEEKHFFPTDVPQSSESMELETNNDSLLTRSSSNTYYDEVEQLLSAADAQPSKSMEVENNSEVLLQRSSSNTYSDEVEQLLTPPRDMSTFAICDHDNLFDDSIGNNKVLSLSDIRNVVNYRIGCATTLSISAHSLVEVLNNNNAWALIRFVCSSIFENKTFGSYQQDIRQLIMRLKHRKNIIIEAGDWAVETIISDFETIFPNCGKSPLKLTDTRLDGNSIMTGDPHLIESEIHPKLRNLGQISNTAYQIAVSNTSGTCTFKCNPESSIAVETLAVHTCYEKEYIAVAKFKVYELTIFFFGLHLANLTRIKISAIDTVKLVELTTQQMSEENAKEYKGNFSRIQTIAMKTGDNSELEELITCSARAVSSGAKMPTGKKQRQGTYVPQVDHIDEVKEEVADNEHDNSPRSHRL